MHSYHAYLPSYLCIQVVSSLNLVAVGIWLKAANVFYTEVNVLICWAAVWIGMWAVARKMAFALRSVLHPHPSRCRPSARPWWHAGFLAVWVWVWVRDGDWDTYGRPHPACFFHLLQFPRCSGYLCHGNCASLPAQTQIPLLVSLVASMMTRQLSQGSQPPPSSASTIHHAHQVVFSHSLLQPDLNTEQTKIIMQPPTVE